MPSTLPSERRLSYVRRTLPHPATVSGITLFTAATTTVTIRPASGSSDGGEGGIVFRRIDLPGSPVIRAHVSHVTPEMRRTVLSAAPVSSGTPEPATVQTVEHLLSALAGCGVTDAVIDIDGPEVPIADGSSLPFVEAIMRVGISDITESGSSSHSRAQPLRDPVVLGAPILIEDQAAHASIHALPTDRAGLELEYHLEYPPGSPIPPQSASLFIPADHPSHDYARDIAPARTFCLAHEAEAMRRAGLFKHLCPAQMLVVGEHGPIENAFRFSNEPARHKLLDLLGDLSLAGRPIQARVIARRAGHSHNHAMARAIASL